MPEHLQSEKPKLSWEQFRKELIQVMAKETHQEERDVQINDEEARKWYNDGFTPYVTFRENWKG